MSHAKVALATVRQRPLVLCEPVIKVPFELMTRATGIAESRVGHIDSRQLTFEASMSRACQIRDAPYRRGNRRVDAARRSRSPRAEREDLLAAARINSKPDRGYA